MKKARYIALILMITLTFSLASCSSDADKNDTTTDGVIGDGLTDDNVTGNTDTDKDDNKDDNKDNSTAGGDTGTTGDVSGENDGQGLITDENGNIDIGETDNDLTGEGKMRIR